ncbi:MAG: DUF305 domain-containing protein [Patescibacteria group bacterium]
MNKNTILVGVVALLIGIIGTNMYYADAVSDARLTQGMSGARNGMHMMSDGTMMGNGMMGASMNMDSMMEGMLANMKGKSGKELEKAFLVDMVPHHQGAVNMAKLLLQDKSVRPELVKFANEIITAQEREIEQMNEWLKNY